MHDAFVDGDARVVVKVPGRARRWWPVVAIVVLASGFLGEARAAGPFDTSTLTPVGDAPAEGLPYTYDLQLRNTGDGIGADVEILIPSAALAIGVDLPGATVDADARVIRWQGEVPPGTHRGAGIRLLGRSDAGGAVSSLRVTVRPWQGDATYLVHAVEVDTRPDPPAFRVGAVGVSAAGVAVLAWLAVAAITWVLVRVVRPRSANWAPMAVVLPLAFLSYFAWLAREDVRIAALPDTTCTVLDRVLDARTSSSSTSPRRGPQTVYQPRVALAWMEAGRARIAQGFGTDSRLSSGRAATADALLARYVIGATVPCAIDDRDPTRAYVERGFGGAYLFALIPAPLLALGIWGLISERRR